MILTDKDAKNLQQSNTFKSIEATSKFVPEPEEEKEVPKTIKFFETKKLHD